MVSSMLEALLDDDRRPRIVCPETRQPLRLAEDSLLTRLRERLERGELTNRGGETVTGDLSAALVREDGRVAYPVIDEIPLLVVEEGLEL